MRQLLQNLSMDEKRTRKVRQESDKMAAIRELWELFRLNLQKHYIPSSNLTVDEQLYGFRGYVPGRAYMPSKPAKYGTKIFWLNDAKNGFALDCYIYSGKSETREVGLAESIVLRLTKGYFNTNRNIYMDRYFTSCKLLINLLQNGLTATGTIPSNRRDVLHEFKVSKERELHSTKAVYEPTNRLMMISYIPKKNESVLLVSSSHKTPEVSQRLDKKPVMVLDYNAGKGGTDLMDSRIEDFSCKRKTRRYPLLFLFNMLDVSLLNSFLICEMNSYTSSRKTFIKAVADQLAAENIQRRMKNSKVMAQSKSAFSAYGLIDAGFSSIPDASKPAGPRKCRFLKCDKSTRNKCQTCSIPVCSVQ